MHKAGMALIVAAAIAAAGCQERLEATYEADHGDLTYRFHEDGRASVSALGSTVPAEYRLEADRVILTSPQGTVVLVREDDRLVGPMGLVMTRLDDPQ